MTITETQPQSPLFPLLPSVQILFAAFCCASIRSDSGGASNIDPDRPAHRHRPLHLAAPFKPRARRGRGRWRTGESPRTLPDDHHRNPTSIPFVSFAAFCSNPLRCLLSEPERSIPILPGKKRTAKLVNLAVLILPDARIVSRRRFSAPHCAASHSFISANVVLH